MLGFYIPPTAKVIRRQDLSSKSHPKDPRSLRSNSGPLVYKASRFIKRVALPLGNRSFFWHYLIGELGIQYIVKERKKHTDMLSHDGIYSWNHYMCCWPSRYCMKCMLTYDYGFRPVITVNDTYMTRNYMMDSVDSNFSMYDIWLAWSTTQVGPIIWPLWKSFE